MSASRGMGPFMAKFFFDVCYDGQRLADEVGAECENIGEAFKTAKHLIACLRDGYSSTSADSCRLGFSKSPIKIIRTYSTYHSLSQVDLMKGFTFGG